MALSQDDKLDLIKMVNADPHLSLDERSRLTSKMQNDSSLLTEVEHGAVGAGIGFATAKFLKLSKNSQILLTIAGFGIGKYLLENDKKSTNLVTNNEKKRLYDINT